MTRFLRRFVRTSIAALDRAWYTLLVADSERVGQCVLSGRLRRSGRLTRSGWVRVVAVDADEISGVAAVWVAIRSYGVYTTTCCIRYEFRASEWSPVGSFMSTADLDFPGRRPSARQSGPACLLTRGAAGGGLSASGWIAYETYRAAREVVKLEIGDRRLVVQPHGYFVVTWRSSRHDGFASRPLIKAVGSNGEVLTELRRGEFVDTASLDSI